MTRDEWIEQIVLSSIPLKNLDGSAEPQGFASGCLIDYCGKRLLLSVEHATSQPGAWAIEMRFTPGKGTELYQVGAMNFLQQLSLTNFQRETIDLSYVIVQSDLTPVYQILNQNGTIETELPRRICGISFEEKPDRRLKYGFSGHTRFSREMHTLINPDLAFLFTVPKTQMDLRYEGSEGHHLLFALPDAHPGHEHFKGCSGAPIIGEDGSIIGLVVGPWQKAELIEGISLASFRSAIDIEVGNFH
jgi:hypothetical protein